MTKLRDSYKLLEDKMLNHDDLEGKDVSDNGESLILVIGTEKLSTNKIINPNIGDVCQKIFLREEVYKLIKKAANKLKTIDERYSFEIVYGYREPEVQNALFQKHKNELNKYFSGKKLITETHRRIASPDVAGHPTGGAIDLQILKNGKPINFGTKIWSFNKDSYTFSPFISNEAKRNRQLLRDTILSVGFAPFDGEWWHFSYGDKEWACYYNKPNAIYGTVNSD